LKHAQIFRMNYLTVDSSVSTQKEASDILKNFLTDIIDSSFFLRELHISLMITEIVDTVYITKLMEYNQEHIDLLNELSKTGCNITVEASNVRKTEKTNQFKLYQIVSIGLLPRII